MSQRTAGKDWLIYTADTGAVLAVDQVEKDKSAIWWLSGVARGDVCPQLESDLRSCAGRVDLLVLVLKDVSDVSSECLQMLVRLQKDVLDARNGELRLVNAKGAVADKLARLRIHLALNVTQETVEQPQTGRPAVETATPVLVKPTLPTDYASVQKSAEPPIQLEITVAASAIEALTPAVNAADTALMLVNPQDGTIYRGTGDETLIGRLPTCDIHLPMPSISRSHVKIFRKDDKWWVQDLGSSFGTRLDAQPLEADKPVALTRHTAVLQLSRYRYHLVLAPYCALIDAQEPVQGPAGRLVHEASGEFLCMTGAVLSLGRKYAPADERVMHSQVISGEHAKIIREADGCCLVDTHSTNGTYLDDTQLTPETPVKLTDGARIRLGSEANGETFRWFEGRGEDPDEA